jgi:DNA polymerase
VNAYREKFWRVVDMWKDQEAAAIRAVRTRKPVDCGYVTWVREDPFLYCMLPSGRMLSYPWPEVRLRMTPWGQEKEALTFMGMNSYTKQWERQGTYGGSIVENITQAVARDIMAEAMVRCEDSGTYRAVLTVHDELVAEATHGEVHEFEQLVAQCPDWATGCPIGVEGWAGIRYRK